MRTRRPALALSLLVVALALALLGATDPTGDFVSCASGASTARTGIDIVDAEGYLTEGGTALLFVVHFATPPPVPDTRGKPFRIDVVLRDPRLPTFSFGPYRRVNRIVRFDATQPPRGLIYLLAERSLSEPSTFGVTGNEYRVTVAGRQFGVNENLASLPLRPLRWTVIARKGPACDALGDGRPDLRLSTASPPPPPSPSAAASPTGPSPAPSSATSGTGGSGDATGTKAIVVAIVVAGVALAALAALASARSRGRRHQPGSPD